MSVPGPTGLDVRAPHRVPVRRAGRSTQIGGENIPVAYIENVLYEHPDLADVAVASGRASPSCSKPREGNHHD
jgi:hypothetical protein